MTKTVVIDIILIIVTVANLLIVYHYGSMVSQDVKRAENVLTLLSDVLKDAANTKPEPPVNTTNSAAKPVTNNNPARLNAAGVNTGINPPNTTSVSQLPKHSISIF